MNELTLRIQELANRCQAILDAMRSPDVHAPRGPSSKTKLAYERQAQQLLHRTLHTEGGLFAVVQSTTRVSTFRKRLVALEHFLGAVGRHARHDVERERTLLTADVERDPLIEVGALEVIGPGPHLVRLQLAQLPQRRGVGRTNALVRDHLVERGPRGLIVREKFTHGGQGIADLFHPGIGDRVISSSRTPVVSRRGATAGQPTSPRR